MFQTPIALIIFNRPECTAKLVDAISVVKPTRLFVIADGPRKNNLADVELCEKTRAIIERIDWPCTISKKYSTFNIGCRESVPLGLNWVFDQVDECIVLEDDCIPQPSFFPFCGELLALYKYDERVMTIGGHRSDGPNEFSSESYYFSKYPSIWGWATWKNRWATFDLQMHQWQRLRESSWLSEILNSSGAVTYWSRMFDKMNGGMDAWDYALTYTCWLNQGLSIRSRVNMITNIGFGKDATHTHETENVKLFAKAADIQFPLRHPDLIQIDEQADNRIEWVNFSGMDTRILENLKQRIHKSRSDGTF